MANFTTGLTVALGAALSAVAITAAAPRLVTRAAVHALVADHTRLPYSSAVSDTWDVLSLADEDPERPGNVVTIYGNGSYPRATAGNSNWDREHLWPQSYGLTNNDPCDYLYTDLYHLRPTEPPLNQSRGNKPFAYCLQRDCSDKPLVDGSGRVNRTWGNGNMGTWEVWPGRRGDVARALLYVDVRYEGGRHKVTGCQEPDMRLTDDRGLIVTKDGPVNEAYMGMLNDLVRWSLEDPPDDGERRRNEVIERHQGNRNPFVDHPEWVCQLWATEPACGARLTMPWAGRASRGDTAIFRPISFRPACSVKSAALRASNPQGRRSGYCSDLNSRTRERGTRPRART